MCAFLSQNFLAVVRIWTNKIAEGGLFLCLQDLCPGAEAGLWSWVGQWVTTISGQWDHVVFASTRLFSFYVHRPLKTLRYVEPIFFSRDGPPAPLYCPLYSLESLLDLDLSFRRNLGEKNIKNGETSICWMNQWVVGYRNQGKLPARMGMNWLVEENRSWVRSS